MIDVPLEFLKAIGDTQGALSVFQDQDWLVWASKMLMPGVYEDVEIEQRAEKEKRWEAEHKEVRQKAEE